MIKNGISQVREQVFSFCKMWGYTDEVIVNNCVGIVDNYLAQDGSRVEVIYDCLQTAIDNNSWILGWKMITDETFKLYRECYTISRYKKKDDEQVLANYEPIDLGKRVFNDSELKRINVNLGVIDSFGVYHTSKRRNVSKNEWPSHRRLANYLKLKEKIIEYYIRVGCICGRNDGILCPDSLYGDEESLNSFLLTENMAIALYNAVMSKKDSRFTTFEEKLAFYGTEFGYYSTKCDRSPLIYDSKLYNNNMKVLSRTLGRRFDKRYFTNILKK